MRDKEGNLLAAYHGSQAFDEFDLSRAENCRINHAIQNGGVLYVSNDKEKIREFSDLRRLQLPTRLEISNFRSDVDTSTSTDSISQTSEKCQPLRQETSFSVVCFCSPVANSVHHPLQRIYHLHRVSFGFSRKISSAVDFSRSRRMRRVHKKDLSQVNHQLHESLAIVTERANGRFTTNNSISQTDGNVNSPLCRAYVNTLGQGMACCCPKLKRKLIYSLFVLT